ncbi:hypothetical protein MPTK1_8g14620 [Marchantia polymorpha subsp. ruderalis]|uniref:non-specific serine/threonine protein kinase n=1 Tax=Marchantia polymorpha TaxID=3197 RepID=A0A2R6W539_MARPO|nr:hypothetical protein MARPO_0151s0044 [Marchantia polymorpha]BBN19891.1 hypothetical protein Mp_8g14620 [Marchantia polymorpha subsp. ruderalis]|eukprot:PTQ28973.1 hypothetical protein MARPO_0151s0044 [Marchantia polymorpha]
MTCATNRVVGETRTVRLGSTATQKSSACCLVYLVFLVTLLDLGLALSSDGLHLLSFKRGITLDTCNVLADWNETHSHPCNWRGVTCDANSLRVVSLNIDGRQAGLVERNGASSGPDLTEVEATASSVVNGSVLSSPLVSSRDGSGPPNSSLRQVLSTPGEAGNSVRCPLSGTLSPEIGNLSELRTLSIIYNKITGEVPRELAKLEFLHTLDLQSNSLNGRLPRELGQLRELRVLNLNNNVLKGHIPRELTFCRKLRSLSLAGNELTGTVPPSLGSLQQLEWLGLSSNQLAGTIPSELTPLRCKLIFLDLSRNGFTGSIPSELGNCGRLRWLSLNSNSLSGSIPPELGRLSSLKYLQVAVNQLSGHIPPQLARCQRLEVLVLSGQSASRSSRKDAPGSWTRRSVRLGSGENNRFEGRLPEGLIFLPVMRVLWAPRAGLLGTFPRVWGACSNLEILNLAQNAFTGEVHEGLSRCKKLIYLDVSSNQLSGSFPPRVSGRCMVVFNVSRNMFSGRLPGLSSLECAKPMPVKDFYNHITWSLLLRHTLNREALSCTHHRCTLLWATHNYSPTSCKTDVVHDWSFNQFAGTIPLSLLGTGISECVSTYSLSMAGNQLTGTISPHLFDVCDKVRGFAVDFSVNKLTGLLPSAVLGKCASLVEFLAAGNDFTGELSAEFGELKNLARLDLSNNHLQGNLPSNLGKMESLKVLLLAQNELCGSLPTSLGHARSLQVLDLSHNAFSGTLPEELSSLRQLQKLYLNHNRFDGLIPAGLCSLSSLVEVNLSCNTFSGSVTWLRNMDSVTFTRRVGGNPMIQGCEVTSELSRRLLQSTMNNYLGGVPPDSVSQMPPGFFEVQNRRLSSILIAAITSGCAIALVLLVLGILFQCTRQRSPTSHCPTPGRKEVVTFMTIHCQMTYESVVRATGNFSIDNLIGNGGFGATYKAELRPGFLVAVKRLAIGRFQGVQQFDTEIRTLGRIRHPNLVTLIGYHASQDEMFLIYNYFPQGNLETLIHSERGDMDWHTRHSIALRIAEALAYLHDECVPRVLHRDIKPSNILLDDNLNAHLSDFGLARLLGTSETHATTDVAGTFGYVAPEYAMTCRVTDKADVYSYGVVLLELLSNKRALGDPSFFEFGDSFNIVSWACLLIRQERAHEVFTVGLWEQGPEDTLLETLKLAVLCTVDSLSIRPSMKQVVNGLKRLQPLPLTT